MDYALSGLPHIETERLHLRPLRLSDAEAFRTMTDEPAILGAVHFLVRPFELANAEKLIVGDDDGRDCFWGAWSRGDPTLLGTVGTHLSGAAIIDSQSVKSAEKGGRGSTRTASMPAKRSRERSAMCWSTPRA